MNVSDPRIKSTIVQLLDWLVSGDYEAIERFTGGSRLSAEVLRQAVSAYGQRLAMPPTAALDQLDVVEIDGAFPKAWSVRVDLWTASEGRSDLSLECTLTDRQGDLLMAEVDNLHVL
jgi:hypothetical protein